MRKVRRALGSLLIPTLIIGHLSQVTAVAQPSNSADLHCYLVDLALQRLESGGGASSVLAPLAEALEMETSAEELPCRGWARNTLGQVYLRLGRADSAIANFVEAAEHWRATGNASDRALALYNTGTTYRMLGRTDSAFLYYEHSLELARSQRDDLQAAVTWNEIGALREELQMYDSALVAYQSGLREGGDALGELERGNLYNNIGVVHRRLARPDSALSFYRKALRLQRPVGNLTGMAIALHNVGLVQGDLSRPDSALAYLHEALALWRDLGDPRWEGESLYEIGFVHHRIADPAELKRAVAYYDSASAAFASVWASAGEDANRMSFAEKATIRSVFENWTLAWLAMDRGADKSDAGLAGMASAERGRSQALLELMRGSVPNPGAGLDLAEEGRSLASEIAIRGTPTINYLVTSDTLVAWLILPSGEVEVARRAISADSLRTLVQALRRSLGADAAAARSRLAGPDDRTSDDGVYPGSAFLGELGEEGMTRGGELSAGAASLDALVDETSRLLLLDELLERVGSGGELAIVPSGVLNLVPFAVLASPGERPLGVRYGIRYTPSLTALAEIYRRPAARRVPGGETTGLRALIVGDPEMPLGLKPLVGARLEAQAVGDQLDVRPLTGADASEAIVRRRLPDVDVAHLATHGFAYSSDARSRDSFIALAPGDGHDGLLTVGEVLDDPSLTLSADLVVLSACQTGLGELKEAEGTVGLQRAFLARGARNVLVSLWSVSDEATKALMVAFYGHWLSDADRPSKAEALRRAQVDVREVWPDPRYWAAFQLVGSG